jgi:hypothetical protein
VRGWQGSAGDLGGATENRLDGGTRTGKGNVRDLNAADDLPSLGSTRKTFGDVPSSAIGAKSL